MNQSSAVPATSERQPALRFNPLPTFLMTHYQNFIGVQEEMRVFAESLLTINANTCMITDKRSLTFVTVS